MYFQSPLLEHMHSPVSGMGVCVRSQGTATETVSYYIEMVHSLIVLRSEADYLLNYRVISLWNGSTGLSGQCGQECHCGSCHESREVWSHKLNEYYN